MDGPWSQSTGKQLNYCVGNKQDSDYRVVGIGFGTKYRLSSDHSLLSSFPGTGPRFLI